MEYQKVGRGGAGNFYTPQAVEKAAQETAKDIEAQRNAASGGVEILESQDRRTSTSTSGRGGAGNVTTRNALDAGTTANIDVTPSMRETKPPELGHYGRGGAGNFRAPDTEKERQEEKDRLEAQEKAHQKAVKDVEMGLKEPEKAHLGRDAPEYDANN